jgi:Ser/Thr protein kinase RdoA (MazF antagonist)
LDVAPGHVDRPAEIDPSVPAKRADQEPNADVDPLSGPGIVVDGPRSELATRVGHVTIAAARVLEAWSEVFSSPVITELTPERVWEVGTERGDRYVLKKVSTFSAPDPVRRFADEARILTHLLQRGVPVAVPVVSNDGKVCATDDDGAPYAVFPMLPADSHDNALGLDPVLAGNIGAAIARLHAALADCPYGIESWTVEPGMLEAWRQTVRDRLPPAVLTELSARIQPRWGLMVRALSAVPQRVHGDVHGGNLRTIGQEVTGIIDCDHLQLAPRGYDLGYYMMFAVRWWLGVSQPSRAVHEIRHLLAGYDAVSPLTRQENDDLPALALAAALGMIAYFLTEHDLAEESWLHTACWIGDHFDDFRLESPRAGFSR